MDFRLVLLQRLISLLLVLISGSNAIFAILRFLPGDPVVVMLGFEYNPEVVEEMRRERPELRRVTPEVEVACHRYEETQDPVPALTMVSELED